MTPVRRGPRVTLWPLRIVITVHLLMVLAQPWLAGQFLTGDVDAIAVHGLVGSLLAAVGLVVIATTLIYVLGGRGKLWVAPVAVALFLADGFQIGAGFARNLALHIPLGVAIIVASVLLAVWVWSPSAGRAR
jgi:signal transduction histidine kinase